MEHLTQEFKPFKTGKSDLEAVLGAEKINTASDTEIKESLRYAMLLVGIRANNMPNDIEKGVLINFIRKNYSGHTSAEIKLAFDKAVACELNLDPKDINAYENFSCAYFGKIMNAYRAWAKEEYRESGLDREKVAELPPPPFNHIAFANEQYKDFLVKSPNPLLIPELLYQSCEVAGMDYSTEQKLVILETARKIMLANYEEEASNLAMNRRSGEVVKIGEFNAILERKTKLLALPIEKSYLDLRVNRYAKALTVINWFNKLFAQGKTEIK